MPSLRGGSVVRHELKTWPVYWEAIYDGRKTFELRKEDDRHFEVGDTLILHLYDPEKEEYDGYSIEAVVTYLLRGPAFGLMEGWVIMGIKVPNQSHVS